MTQSDPFEIRAGESFHLNVRMPLDSLAPGEYGMKLSLLSGTPKGKSSYYDTIDDVGHFVILEDAAVNAGFKWSTRKWGHVRLKPLEIH